MRSLWESKSGRSKGVRIGCADKNSVNFLLSAVGIHKGPHRYHRFSPKDILKYILDNSRF